MPDKTVEASHIFVGTDDDASAIATITSVWTAPWDERFTSEAPATLPAVSGATLNFNAIDKHDLPATSKSSGSDDYLSERLTGFPSIWCHTPDPGIATLALRHLASGKSERVILAK